MEQQDLLNALKGKRLHWRDEDNEYDGVIRHITTTNESEYVLLFDDFVSVAMDKLHIEELATTGYTYDGKYSYNLDRSPIDYIRKALMGKRLHWGVGRDVTISPITEVRENKVLNEVIVVAGIGVSMEYPTVYELIAKGESSDEHYQYRLLDDEETTTITGNETATSTSGDVVYSNGIDWEGRIWGVFRYLVLEGGGDIKTALSNARGMVETYRKAMEDEV